MKLVYTDEAGDPGYPKYESPCFFLTFLYLNVEKWGECFEHILCTRRQLKNSGLPIRLEFHTREFVLNKNPYHKLKLSNKKRIEIIDTLVDSISKLAQYNLHAINIAIIKERLNGKYDVLSKAYEYGLTRIDTNLHMDKNKILSEQEYKYGKFLLLIDDGYLLKVRKVCRKMYRYNYVPYEGTESSRQIKLKSMIDDPLPKNSKNSYFIQLADLIVYLISQYVYIKLNINQSPKRKKLIPDEKMYAYGKPA